MQTPRSEWRLTALQTDFRGWLVVRANNALIESTFCRVRSQFHKSCNLCTTFGVDALDPNPPSWEATKRSASVAVPRKGISEMQI
jgi:hypothetical protein